MNDYDIVVAIRRSDGTLDSRYIQPLKQFLYEVQSIDIVKRLVGEELLDLLANDLGIVKVDHEKLKLQYVKPGQRGDGNVHQEVMNLLGRLAEALIVRRCNKDIKRNRLWASYARRGRQVESLDEYIAVGTGLVSTKHNSIYNTKYNPSDTQRDIIWVKKDDPMKELQMGKKHKGGYPVGLQIKVSRNKNTVFNSLVKRTYGVPVIYFDLNRDFPQVADKLLQENLRWDEEMKWRTGVDFIRGRDIDPELHDTLLHFYPLIELLFRGKLDLGDLLQEIPEVETALTSRFIETTETKEVEILTLPMSPISSFFVSLTDGLKNMPKLPIFGQQ
ncbi:hypothetical protein FJR38_20745 [Anabaena sp. UHCC 0253]|uniref:hypothetical protein n=1 Tax=Anabaena sp. UHCC 0253 TaxID=2590019 RepID=UPI001445DBFC|nr:hypothetical protein [Anabaena sp. UHCC 0253]MTJ54917.1 hypothetical protein [Anabaena sp. UHCC 0253]